MSQKNNSNIKGGARILILFFVLLFFLLFARIIYIQASKSVDGQVLTAMAEEKWTKNRTLEADRGLILDRNGAVIAKDIPSYTVYAIVDETFTKKPDKPQHVVNPKEAAKKLAPILEMDEFKVESILSTDGVFQVEFGASGRNVSQQVKEEIEKLDISGIGFFRNKKRHYPNGIFASHVIGYVDLKNNKFEGQMGIEETLDKYMQGVNGKVSYQSDRKGIKLPDPNEMVDSPENGNDVYLTIDQKIQTFLESALSNVEKEYKPEKIMAIVADPKTGEILAMGNRPSFNPNLRDIKNYLNDTVSYSFEPGSTMKVFTLAAALNEGVFNPNETYQSGTYKIAPNIRAIGDHNGRRGWGEISFLEGVQRSSNVAFAILANEKLGTDKLLTYLHRFGFHQKTGVDIPGEVSGNILYRYPLEKTTTAFGQGSTITPIQQIQAATAVASDGKMKKPYVVKEIVDSKTQEVILENQTEIVGEPITADTAKKVRDILETVVTAPEGTGYRYKIDGYSVAGKTGTAQIPDPETGRYMGGHGNNIFSFLGMAPKDNPELIMYVAIKQPKLKAVESGSEPISYIFKTVMKNSLHYLNVNPTKEPTENVQSSTAKEGIVSKSYIGSKAENIVENIESQGVHVTILGSEGEIISQLPHEGERLIPGDRLILKRKGKITMPDLVGWSLRDVMKLSYILNLKPNFVGHGYVNKQNINPGTEVKEGDYLVVEFQPPVSEKINDEGKENEEDGNDLREENIMD